MGYPLALLRRRRGLGALLGQYASSSGVAPSFVFDASRQVYAIDPSGWAETYRAGGVLPALVLDFEADTYGGPE